VRTLNLGTGVAGIFVVTSARAGGPTPEHPCPGIAACDTQTSQRVFSACIKANKAEADANEGCASFRKDKDAWLEPHGLSDLRDLFAS